MTAASSASPALTTAVDMAAHAYQRDGKLSGLATGLRDLDRKMGGLQTVRPDHPRRPPRHGQDRARHQHRLQHRQSLARRGAPRRPDRSVNGGIVGFFSLEMSAEQLATRIISEQTEIPSERILRGEITERDFERIKDVADRDGAPAVLSSTRPAASRSRSSRRARAGSSASAASTSW